MKFVYHPDHLGSASFVTNENGAVCQHLQYLPFGEIFVIQRNSEFDTRYKFTAKELDNESSYTYFGARYYDSDLSVWLSVDPMADKYPSTSAYMYCLGNPVKLIDPSGRDTAFADNQARNDFLAALSIVNNKISDISNNISNLKSQPSTKKIERQIKGLEGELSQQQKLKDDFDYICSSNTPRITYSSDVSKLKEKEAGRTIQTYNKQTLEILSADVYVRPGMLSSYIHENRHTRQNPTLSECEREIEAYQYQSIFSHSDVQDIINYYKNKQYPPDIYPVDLIPKNYGIKEMVKYVYECE